MIELENQSYLYMYIASNVVALGLLLLAWKWPKVARLLFFGIFLWACWINWNTVIQHPQDYIGYADLAFVEDYKKFINGWFSRNVLLAVGFIATAQGLIAISLLLKGRIYKLGVVGAIAFLFSIMPLGVGSAFPCTLIMAAAMMFLYEDHKEYIWQRKKGHTIVAVN